MHFSVHWSERKKSCDMHFSVHWSERKNSCDMHCSQQWTRYNLQICRYVKWNYEHLGSRAINYHTHIHLWPLTITLCALYSKQMDWVFTIQMINKRSQLNLKLKKGAQRLQRSRSVVFNSRRNMRVTPWRPVRLLDAQLDVLVRCHWAMEGCQRQVQPTV